MNLQEMMQERKSSLDAAEALVNAAEAGNRAFTPAEDGQYKTHMEKFRNLSATIKAREEQSTIRAVFGNRPMVEPPRAGSPAPDGALHGRPRIANVRPMSAEYNDAFLAFLRSNGKHASDTLSEGFDPLFGGFALPALPRMQSALYEGSTGAGGATVSVPTAAQMLVPLGVPDLGVRSVASVIATSTDIKIPRQTAFATAGLKAESGASTVNFAESDPTLEQFTLSAYMLGLYNAVSWELLQDVELFQRFAVEDLLRAVQIAEDGYFVNGTGSSQPKGLIGNTGTGTGAAYAVESTGNYLLQATIDVLGTLKAQYFPTAGYLMNRATATAIRKAQQQANLFAPVWTRENNRDYLHGFPVTYSAAMPSLPTATTAGVTPILFGSFSDGYVIGDRGGSGIFVKILDQPLALSGQTALLAYRRTDGQIRISEALQQISISHS